MRMNEIDQLRFIKKGHGVIKKKREKERTWCYQKRKKKGHRLIYTNYTNYLAPLQKCGHMSTICESLIVNIMSTFR